MKKIAVTGGSGSTERGIGAVVVKSLVDRGLEVVNLDIAPPRQDVGEYRRVDLTDYGDTFTNLHGCDAVVHLAANANPDLDHFTGAQRFHLNTLSTYNIFQAAATLGMKKIVWASSANIHGFPFEAFVPPLLPTHDDEPVNPTGSYGISKVVCEEMAKHLYRLHQMPIIGLRFSNIYYDTPGHETGYDQLPQYWNRPEDKKTNLWGYVDSRDIMQSIEKALFSDIKGADSFTIAAADTNMKLTSQELVERFFPGSKLRPGTPSHGTLIGIDKAHEALGYSPQYSWRDILDEN